METHRLRAVSILVPVKDIQLRADSSTDILIMRVEIGKLAVSVQDAGRLCLELVVGSDHIALRSSRALCSSSTVL